MGVRLSTYDSTWPFLVKPGPSSVWVLEAQVLASEHHVPNRRRAAVAATGSLRSCRATRLGR
jgi:hypothetical protein